MVKVRARRYNFGGSDSGFLTSFPLETQFYIRLQICPEALYTETT
jgi:hypothetical protein